MLDNQGVISLRKVAFAAVGMVLVVALFATLVGLAANWWEGSALHSITQAATQGMTTGDPAAFLTGSMETSARLKLELILIGMVASASSGAITAALLRNVHWAVALLHPVPLSIMDLGLLERPLGILAFCTSAGLASWLVYRRRNDTTDP